LPALHLRPIDPVIFREPSVQPLTSFQCLPAAFGGSVHRSPGSGGRRWSEVSGWMGDLVFGGAWRLDAFSAYPFAT